MPREIQRSVRDVDFVGWKFLENLVQKATSPARELILVGFKTGARISEMLPLEANDFAVGDEFISTRTRLRKRYRKVRDVTKWKCLKCTRKWIEEPQESELKNCIGGGDHNVKEYLGYETRPLERFRRIEFPVEEPLSPELIEFINSTKGLLFPHPRDPGRPMHRSYAYVKVTEVDDRIWLHWLRAQRACQLSDEAGFSIRELEDWFNWKSEKYARLYSSRRYQIREKMLHPPRRIK